MIMKRFPGGIIKLSDPHYCSSCGQILYLCEFAVCGDIIITLCSHCELTKYIEIECSNFTFDENDSCKKIKVSSLEERDYFIWLFNSLRTNQS